MRFAELTQHGFIIREKPTPKCGPDDVLVQTVGCGICSGEVFIYSQRATMQAPWIPGHEGSGVVVDVGSHVEGFSIGDKITALVGLYAEYFLAKPQYLVKLPDNVDPEWALGEPVACAVHACNRLRISKADRVAIVGCGFMGLVCLQLVKQRGAGTISAIDPIIWRLDMASDLGADAIYTPDEAPMNDDPFAPGNFDVVIEAAGTQSAIDLCPYLVDLHGQINLVGYHQSNDGLRKLNMRQWNFKGIDVINGHVRHDGEKLEAMRQGIDLMRQRQLQMQPLVKYYEISDTESAFSDIINQREGLFKVVLVPDSSTV